MMQKMGILKCHICGSSHSSLLEINRHITKIHQGHWHNYVICCGQKQFKDRLYDHMRYHKNNELFKCQEAEGDGTCGQLCLSGHDLADHKKKKHGIGHGTQKQYDILCPVCPRTFTRSSTLESHLEKCHRPTTGYQCEECGRYLPSKYSYKTHKLSHGEPSPAPAHICHVCGKGFKDKATLQGHENSHTRAPRSHWQECDICNKFFADVNKHKINTHTEATTIECYACKKIVKSTFIGRHIRKYHSPVPAEKHKCTICAKEFAMKDNLGKHMDIHLGVRFPCFFCPETYGASCNRNKHLLRKHAEEYAKYKRDNEEKLRVKS